MSVPVKIDVLRDKFKAIVSAIPDIKSFIFDDLSKINHDRDKDYPAFLLKPPTKYRDYTDPQNRKYYSFYNIDFFIFNPGSQDDDFDYATIWAQLEPYGDQVCNAIDRSEGGAYLIMGRADIEYGHHEHNDSLYGVRFKFVLRVYDGC